MTSWASTVAPGFEAYGPLPEKGALNQGSALIPTVSHGQSCADHMKSIYLLHPKSTKFHVGDIGLLM